MDLNGYKESLQKQVVALKQTREELQVRMHAARSEARDEWHKLGKSWGAMQDELRRIGQEAKQPLTQMARGLIGDLQHSYQRIRESLKH